MAKASPERSAEVTINITTPDAQHLLDGLPHMDLKQAQGVRALIQHIAELEANQKREVVKPVDHKNPDLDLLLDLMAELRSIQQELYDRLDKVAEQHKKRETTIPDLTDAGFICREAEELFDEMRKQAKAHKELAAKVLYLTMAERAISHPETAEEKSKGALASATPRVSIIADQPHRGTDEYVAFMRDVYVPDRIIADGLLKPDFKALGELVTRLIEDGKPLPPGINRTWKAYDAVYVRKRGLRI